MKKYFVIAAGLAAISAPAAADVGGGRVEVLAGWDHVSIDLGDGLTPQNADGVVYGIGGGYDFALNDKFAVGIDAEATLATTELEIGDVEEDGIEFDAKRDLYIGGRITAALADNFNLYGKAGYTNARIRTAITEDGDTVIDSANGDGVRLGLGGQMLVGTNAYVGVEYRYSNYEADVSRSQLVGSVGFRF